MTSPAFIRSPWALCGTVLCVAVTWSVSRVSFADDAAPSANPSAPAPDAAREHQALVDAAHRAADVFRMAGAPLEQQAQDDDPLKAISDSMTVVHTGLTALQTDKVVQTQEQDVTVQLNALIAQIEAQAKKSGNGNKPNTGRKASVIANGDPTAGALHDPNQQGQIWGQLPPKEREQILQSKTEGFPPGYESLLQSYYQRLAQEKVTETNAPPAPAAAAPVK